MGRKHAHSSVAKRTKLDPTISRVKSAISNGRLLTDVDGRSAVMRRFRDLMVAFHSDLGGEDILSEGQKAIARRAVVLGLQLEMMERRFADNDGRATPLQLKSYIRATNSQRRLIETLGLHIGRRARDTTPSLAQYIHTTYGEAEEAEEATG